MLQENTMLNDERMKDEHGMVGSRPSIKKLCVSAREGDLDVLKGQLDHLSDQKRSKYINRRDKDQHTPLHYAARYNHSHVVDYLIENGADIGSKDRDKATPLHYAARYKPDAIEQVDTGVAKSNQADVNIKDVPDGEREASHYTVTDDIMKVQDEIIQRFIKNGAEVNSKDKHGMTPLHLAAMKGNRPAVNTLLDIKGIDIKATDMQGMTPVHLAAMHNQPDVVKALVDAKAPIVVKGGVLCSTPLHLACTEGSVDIARMLFAADKELGNRIVNEIDRHNSTPLHRAVEGGHMEVAEECIKHGAKVNAIRTDETAPLHLAAKSGSESVVKVLLKEKANINATNDQNETPLYKAASRGYYKICDLLISRSAEVNTRNKDGLTALLKAARKGHVNTVKVLLDSNADVRVADKNGKSAIYLAAEEDNLETLQCLLRHYRMTNAGMINACDCYGDTPLHVAAEKGYTRIVQYLLDRGANKFIRNEREQTALHLASKKGKTKVLDVLLGKDKALLNDEEEQACTPLHLASDEGQVRTVEVLIQVGADIDTLNHDKKTALHLAAAGGWSRTANVLLQNGCQVDPQDMKKRTPLQLAARKGNDGVVKLLLEYKADLGLTDETGSNCLDLAIDKGHRNVAMTIINSTKWTDALKNAQRVLKYSDSGVNDTPQSNNYSLLPNRIVGNTNRFYDTPMRKLIRTMPDVAEEVFSRCCDPKGTKPSDLNYKIEYNYEFLDDVYLLQRWVKEDLDDGGSSTTDTAMNSYDSKSKKLMPGVQPYTEDIIILSENHPLQIMVSSKRQDLLSHPLVTALLRQKWKTGRILYYVNLSVYLLFLFFLTGYVLDDTGRGTYQYINFTQLTTYNGTECEQVVQYTADLGKAYQQSSFSEVCKYGSIVLVLIIAVREITQIIQGKWFYFMNYTNYIEWTIIITTLLLCLDFDNPCQRETGVRLPWQWQISGIAIFWAWLDLVLFMRKVPIIGIYSVMFTDVLMTFIRFFPVLFLLATAFCLSFHTLLGNQFPFRTLLASWVKTFTMMTGDLDYSVIAHEPYTSDHHIQSWYNFASTAQFVLFIVIMIIIVMNLLIGLAVSDIKTVQEQAALKRKAMQVELTLSFEGMLLKLRHSKRFCGLFKNICSSRISETLKINKPRKWYQKIFPRETVSPVRIARVLVKNSDVAEQDKLAEQVDNIEHRMKSMEVMMKALIKYHKIELDANVFN